MAEKRVVIIHGYSDCSDSFGAVKACLIKNGIGSVETILYADYLSREDSLTFNDVVDGLNEAFKVAGIIDADGRALVDLSVILHSTGGLVIRHWISTYYGTDPIACPVKKIVMLAPANFGSPLAHRGKSFLGSLVKGRWKVGDFLEVGRNLLSGLELGSPFQWALAHKDLLRNAPLYHAKNIQVTVLVGIEDYTGLLGWVNKPGTDGTVVIAGASLDTVKLTCSFERKAGASNRTYGWKNVNTVEEFAFGVLPGVDHGTIVDKFEAAGVAKYVLKALGADEEGFRSLIKELDELTDKTHANAKQPQYQQFIVRAIDDLGEELKDFTLDFFVTLVDIRNNAGKTTVEVLPNLDPESSVEINNLICSEFHAHTGNPSYRRFLIDPKKIVGRVKAAEAAINKGRADDKLDVGLCMRISVPPVEKNIHFQAEDLKEVLLYCPGLKDLQEVTFFAPNTTTLVELCVNRFSSYVTIGKEPRKHQ